MKVSFSSYLKNEKSKLKKILDILKKRFEFVSILGTDTDGKKYSIQNNGIDIEDSPWSERGFVIRVYNGINYSEYSFNKFPERDIDSFGQKIIDKLELNMNKIKQRDLKSNEYPLIKEKKIDNMYSREIEKLPGTMGIKEKINLLSKIKDKAMALSEYLIDFRINYEEVKVAKLYISENKDLEQSYIWSQAYLAAIVRKDGVTKYYYRGFSGLKGEELLEELKNNYQNLVKNAEELLVADRIKPGLYDVICSPDVAGLIAHEAFGHGVEMDMFVKDRAKAVEYLDKQVASSIVNMHDGAAAAQHVSSYFFDDEGVEASDTLIIENGILKRGISDLLSAYQLGTKPTGNGKRESFARKAYSRMTNTFFSTAEDKLEDMISSINEGYLLDGVLSGMEDPKNWGIQCMILQGKEIKDGELTGNICSPIIMTGYVPDLLKNISMVSKKLELSGTGACGKGHKEWVKVSSGGPYIKTKARLG